MKKRIITLVFLSAMVIGLSSVTSVTSLGMGYQGYDAKVGMVFSTGGLGDFSFNDAANRGLFTAENRYNLSVSRVEPADIPAITTNLNAYGSQGTFDVIITPGFSSKAGVEAAAGTYTTENFTLIDEVVDLPNVYSIVFREEQGAFLAGAMAALTTQTGKLGFLGGQKVPVIDAFASGYEQGAKYIDPTVTVTIAYGSDPLNPWNNVADGKAIAETQFAAGIDIIFAAAGGTGVGVFQAAQEARDLGSDVYAIGVDSNQDDLFPGTILTSVLKRVDWAVTDTIEKVVNQQFPGGTNVSLGVEGEWMSISPMLETQAVANEVCGEMTRLEYVNALTPSLTHDPTSSGLFVNRTILDAGTHNTVAHPCGTPPPGPTNVTETSTVVSTSVQTSVSVSVSTDEGGVNVALLPIFAAVFTTIFFVRKKK